MPCQVFGEPELLEDESTVLDGELVAMAGISCRSCCAERGRGNGNTD
jgi:hypothetical protein